MDEKEIKEVFLKGESEAFKKVVEAYGPQMMALSLNMVGNREDAEDICQEAFLQAFRHWDRFDRKQSLRNWLLTIVFRRSLDLVRKKTRFYRFLAKLRDDFLSFRREANFAGLQSTGSSYQKIPPQALDGLTPKEKAILTLWAREGYTSEEIAGVIGCRPATARVHLFLARQKIKTWLEKHNESL